MNIWKKAAKENLVIITERGQASFLNLWNMPVESNTGLSLDYIYKVANKNINENEVSLVTANKTNPEKEHWELVKALVEDVYADIKREQELAAKRKELHERYLKLKEVMQQKEIQELTSAKKEELEAQLKEIEKALKA